MTASVFDLVTVGIPPSLVDSGEDVASVELVHQVDLQDFTACERCQPAMSAKVDASVGNLVSAEHQIRKFHGWVQKQLAPPVVNWIGTGNPS